MGPDFLNTNASEYLNEFIKSRRIMAIDVAQIGSLSWLLHSIITGFITAFTWVCSIAIVYLSIIPSFHPTYIF